MTPLSILLALLPVVLPGDRTPATQPGAPLAAAPGAWSAASSSAAVHGELLVNRRITLDVTGPAVAEDDATNPFLDYRFDVVFRHLQSGQTRVVPGYFAADGQAHETSASTGDVWRAHLSPDLPGRWSWRLIFREGPFVAVSSDPGAGAPHPLHGLTGWFDVDTTPPTGNLLRDEGRLVHTGGHHLRHQGSGRPWLQMGANSPENLLGYGDFDQTPDSHQYAPHLGDWQAGDPQWQGSRGRGLVGAMNYLVSRGMNTVWMLTFNAGGDGHDVWPWTSSDERLRYDVSKLAQWEIVLEHMDELGLSMQLVLQEQEIDDGEPALDGGELGVERRLYHRELVARFGHHLGLVFNLGEENQNTTEQQVAFHQDLQTLDAYDHPIALHTFPTTIPVVYPKLLEAGVLQVASLQVLDPADVYQTTRDVRSWSEDAGVPWVVQLDEIGPPNDGVLPDAFDPAQDMARVDVLWGNLMAGGGGCQWYFGYDWPDDDLDCEDWRSRQTVWDLSSHALSFFATLPFDQMQPTDDALLAGDAWVLVRADDLWAAYLPTGGGATLDVGPLQASYDVTWFDPRGGAFMPPAQPVMVAAGEPLVLAAPDAAPDADWAARIERVGVAPFVGTLAIGPKPLKDGADVVVASVVDDEDGDVVSVTLEIATALGQLVAAVPMEADAGGSRWSITFPNAVLPPPGTWKLTVVATDALGHESRRSQSLVIASLLKGPGA